MTSLAGDPPAQDRWTTAWGQVTPRLLYGLRFWASICLALYVAFWLELDAPNWAGTSAGIVAQPTLGQSIRKATFRLIGTAVGALATVLLTALVPQDRVLFLLGMALWTAACSFASTLLRNFAAYGAMLAGYTMVIIASDSITQPNQVFELAISRTSEIWIGIVCATVVIAGTDFGAARRQLTQTLGGLVDEIVAQVHSTLGAAGAPIENDRAARRALVRRVAALDPLIDQATGEVAELRHRRATLHVALSGLFDALIGWRALVLHLRTLGLVEARIQAQTILRSIAPTLAPTGGVKEWTARRSRAARVTRDLMGIETQDPSVRLLADASARVALGIRTAANGLVLLEDPARAELMRRPFRVDVPDILPPLVNALRVFLTVVVSTLFWIVTEWPSGLSAVTFATVTVMLLSPQQEQGVKASVGFGLGTLIATAVAGIVKFALLPNHDTFLGFALVVGIAAEPFAPLSTVPGLKGVFTGAAMNFIPLLGPTNQITYDTVSFYNAALGIAGGCLFGALMMRLLPPIAPAIRTRRLASLTLREMRGLARRQGKLPTLDAWRRRIALRLVAVPEEADLVFGAQIMAALSVGRQVIRLRRYTRRRSLEEPVSAALTALADGDIPAFDARLSELDARLADDDPDRTRHAARLRARTAIRVMREAITDHEAYFGAAP